MMYGKLNLYRSALVSDAGVDIVMTSHILYESLDPENPATFSKTILQDILREKLGFQGVVISDSMNMHALQNYYKPVDAAVAALSAGVRFNNA